MLKNSTALSVALLWLGAALVISLSGLLAQVPMPFPQVVLATLTTLLLVMFGRVRPVRRWLLQVDLRALLLLHVTRLAGAYFVFLHLRSELPYAFAIPAGVGDMAVAASALGVALISPRHAVGRLVWLGWNIMALAVSLFAIVTATRLGLAEPLSMGAFTRFPLGLLPTFLIPLGLVSHVVLFVRLTGVSTQPRERCVGGHPRPSPAN